MEIDATQLLMLCQHATSAAQEVCGVLLGRRAPELALRTIVAGRNVHPSPAQHFLLDAATLLQADAEARARDLEIIGFYHSHPNSRPLPSSTDRQAAWPGYLMLIVARAGPRCVVSAWVVAADGTLRPESIRPRPTDGARPAQIEP